MNAGDDREVRGSVSEISPARQAARFAGASSFLLFFATLPATVTLDSLSPSLACAADTVGIANSPGYPAWTMLAWLFCRAFSFVTYHGHPNPAWAVALFSAVCGAGACALWAAIITRVLPERLAPRLRALLAAACALYAGFNRAWWGEVVIPETTAFHLLLWSGFLLQVLRTDERATGARCLSLGLLASSALLASYSFVLAAPLLPALWWRIARRHGWSGPAGWFIIGFALGLLPLLYLPIAASHNPPFNWGAAYTWEGFLHLVSRGQYERVLLLSPLHEAAKWGRELAGWVALAREFLGWPVLLAAAAGLLYAARRGPTRGPRLWLAAVFALYTLGMTLGLPTTLGQQTNMVALPLWTPSFALVVALAAAGCGELIAAAGPRVKPVVLRACVALLALVLLAVPLWRNACDERLVQRWGASERGWFAVMRHADRG